CNSNDIRSAMTMTLYCDNNQSTASIFDKPFVYNKQPIFSSLITYLSSSLITYPSLPLITHLSSPSITHLFSPDQDSLVQDHSHSTNVL
ncbi:33091_t:CDS:2, partial [Racocetra persica]